MWFNIFSVILVIVKISTHVNQRLFDWRWWIKWDFLWNDVPEIKQNRRIKASDISLVQHIFLLGQFCLIKLQNVMKSSIDAGWLAKKLFEMASNIKENSLIKLMVSFFYEIQYPYTFRYNSLWNIAWRYFGKENLLWQLYYQTNIIIHSCINCVTVQQCQHFPLKQNSCHSFTPFHLSYHDKANIFADMILWQSHAKFVISFLSQLYHLIIITLIFWICYKINLKFKIHINNIIQIMLDTNIYMCWMVKVASQTVWTVSKC